MKQLFSIVIACLVLPITTKGQNVPVVSPSLPPVTHTVTLPQAFSPANNVFNFSRTWMPLYAITDPANIMFTRRPTAALAQYCNVATNYTNGWGSTIETIKRGSAQVGSTDVVIAKDNRTSLTSTGFLPFTAPAGSQFQITPFTDEGVYYYHHYPAEGASAYSQSVSSVDNNTLIPTTMNYSPGASFIGQAAGTKVQTTYNDATDPLHSIPKFSYDVSLTQNGYYPSLQLTEKTTTMQNGGLTYEFYDKNNRLVCKQVYQPVIQNINGNNVTTSTYLTTYYVYDDLGRLRLVIPPSQSNTPADNAQDYHYNYNAYGQIVSKGIPDQQGYEYTVYDSRQRPVLFQTPLMAAQQKMQFTLYDNLNRVLVQGYTYARGNPSYSQWQSWLDNPSSAPTSSFPLLNYFINYTPITSIPTIANCEIDVVNYYDQLPAGNSAFSGAAFNTGFASDYQQSGITPVANRVTKGLLVGSQVLVRDSSLTNTANKWITSTYFYDQQGQLIQTQTLNPWNLTNKDVITSQYNFTHQKVLDVMQYYDHSTSNKPATKMVKVYAYDDNNGSRLTRTDVSFDNTGIHTVNAFTYDDLGRVRTKTMGGTEQQTYDYNIRGQLAAINGDYALNANDPNGNITFGCTLNYDEGFTTPRLDGKISGMIWRGAGSGTPERAYGYQYDYAGRLVAGNYNEIDYATGGAYTAWGNTIGDYSMTNVTYDQNGNIKSMNQMGTPGGASPMPIDQLTYTYNNNQLATVHDVINVNFALGDFTNGHGCGTCSYQYDVDGNLTVDPNKQITGIAYNEQDQPVLVNFATGASIKNVYDGSGTLVRKIINYNYNGIVQDYRYWGPFVNRNDTLLYVLHDEGRARYLADTQVFRFDYFVKDHLGNVRSVVTADQAPPQTYLATNELISANSENLMFTNLDAVRADNPLPVETNQKAVELNGSSNTVGTSILLHAMAGDKFDISAQSYWQQDNSSGAQYYDDGGTLVSALVSTLAGGTPGPSFNEGVATTFSGAVNTSLSSNLEAFQTIMNNATVPGVPRAYIMYLVFDQSMNLLANQSGAVQIGTTQGSWQPIGTTGSVTPQQNGYVLVTLVNAQTQAVWFDNTSITVHTGRLLQEQNYYPFGLTINEGQSATTLANKFLWQGKEMNDQLGLDWYDFTARQYDPQIGRFWGVDPADQFPSGYTGMGNDPANQVDPTGMVTGSLSGGIPNPYATDAGTASRSNNFSDAETSQSGLNAGDNVVGPADIIDIGARDKQAETDRATSQLQSALQTMQVLTATSAQTTDANASTTPDNATGALNSGNDATNSNGTNSGNRNNSVRTITIYRINATAEYTQGVFSTDDNKVQGYTLEPPGPSTTVPNQDQRIPAGTYDLTPHDNAALHSKYELYNDDVPKSRAILMHIGNTAEDTEGCILIGGGNNNKGNIAPSRQKIEQLNNWIKSNNGNVRVTIYDPLNQ